MSALDTVINICRDYFFQPTEEEVSTARSELAQLRADLQAAQERIAEQAHKLDEARIMISMINQKTYLKRDLQVEVNHWLAANPAPQVEQP